MYLSLCNSQLKKGAPIKSYLISHAYITPGARCTKHENLSYGGLKTLGILYCKCVNLYLLNVHLDLIRILCQSRPSRCLKTASARCVFKIYNVTRLDFLNIWILTTPPNQQIRQGSSNENQVKMMLKVRLQGLIRKSADSSQILN